MEIKKKAKNCLFFSSHRGFPSGIIGEDCVCEKLLKSDQHS